MPKLKYFGSKISDNIIKTDEGYIICLNVPICRTGWQTYTGRELGEDTQREHSIGDSDKVKVYRSSAEVFDPDTLRSFETQPVTDNHPSGGRFVTPSNYSELLRGHAQNVRRGGELDDGEEVMLADLKILDKDLVQEVLDEVKREVSCGYDYRLRLRSDGDFEQYEIRGNHVAIVPKGRAGDKVRIMDADPAEQEKESPVEKPTGMSWLRYFTSLGMKQHAADAKPEDMAEALDELRKEEPQMSESKKDSLSADAVLRAKDAEIEELKSKLKESEDKKGKDAGAHEAGCDCSKCMDAKAKDKKGKDAKAKDARGKDAFTKKVMDSVKKMLDEYMDEGGESAADAEEGEEEKEPKGEDAEEGEEEEEGKKGEDARLEPIPDLPKSERPKNPIPGADADVLAVLRETRSIVAKSGDRALIKKWNRAYDAAMPSRKASTRGGYDELANRDGAARKAADAAADEGEEKTQDQLNAEYQSKLDAANIRSPKGGK